MNALLTLTGLLDLLKNGLTSMWTGSSLVLGTNLLTPTRGSAFADLTAPTMTGYAAKPVTWSAPSYDPVTGRARVLGTAVYEWFGPSDATGQAIQSFGLNQPGSAGPPIVPAGLLCCGNLAGPVNLLAPTDTLALTIELWSDGTVNVYQQS